MVHLVNSGYVPQNAKRLLGDARQMCSKMDIIIRDCRVSVKCVEFDVSLNAKTTDELVERLLPIGPLERAKLVTEEYIPKDDAIKLGVEYFNTQRFWECHEVLLHHLLEYILQLPVLHAPRVLSVKASPLAHQLSLR